MKKLFIIGICCLFGAFITPVQAQEENNITSNMETRADTKEWKYSIRNGYLYKRLWNATQKKWETGWIRV